MSQSLLSAQASTLPCPSCGQMIYSDAAQCRFCSAAIDPKAAVEGANLQAQVNNACNQAKMIRHMATAMWVLFGVGLIFSAGTIAVMAFFFIVPASLILWQIKYGRLETADPDFKRAKRDRLIAIALWLPAGLLQFAVIALSAIGS
ncbi:MAG: hypothetical protein JWM21_1048 [Acidobacteria bacterium]|nr:hypothetical protein [Acidobacteriota bacterium]